MNFFKKIYNSIMNERKLEKYKTELYGKEFQWVRPINHEEVGEVVRCTNVREKGDIIVAEFSAGTPVNVDLISNYLIPHNASDPGLLNPKARAEFDMKAKLPQKPQEKKPAEKDDIFKNLSTQDTNLSLTVKVKIPNLELVKMMYKNAADSKLFLNDFASYIHGHITTETVKVSMLEFLEDINKDAHEQPADSIKITAQDNE